MNWIPIIDKESGKPPNYTGWDTPEKKKTRLQYHIISLQKEQVVSFNDIVSKIVNHAV